MRGSEGLGLGLGLGLALALGNPEKIQDLTET